MCGRYYVDDETAREIERIIRIADEKVKRMSATEFTLQAKDIHPTDTAPRGIFHDRTRKISRAYSAHPQRFLQDCHSPRCHRRSTEHTKPKSPTTLIKIKR